MTGSQLGPYRLIEKVAAGGMGEVYRARDERLRREVAVKLLAPLDGQGAARERFDREARAIAALQHPHICTIHDVGETPDGQPYLIMELLGGETLQQRLAGGALELGETIDIAVKLADAIDAAHRAGIIHRDLKPGNIALTSRGPKILDFGLAKTRPDQPGALSMDETVSAAAPVTLPGILLGTLTYMSPEQLRGEPVDSRSDLFSLGLVLYEMLTGRRAFTGATPAAIGAAILHESPPSPRSIRPDIPPRLEEVVHKALEKEPALRYQHASDMRADLQRIERDLSGASAVRPVAVATVEPVQRRRAARWLALAALGLLLGAGALYVWKSASSPILTTRDRILIADFANTTGETIFDTTLRQGLSVQIGQSPYLQLVPPERVAGILKTMQQPAETVLLGAVARDVCVRAGAAAVLEGSIAPVGAQYVLGLRATACQTGEVLAEEQVTAARKEYVLPRLSEVAATVRTRLGESRATVEQYYTPLDVTTPSLEAWKAFSVGASSFFTRGAAAAAPFFARAVEIDDEFASAHAWLSMMYSVMGETHAAREAATRAYELRDRATDRERLFIEFAYDRQLTGNLLGARQTLQSWIQAYPEDAMAHGLLSGVSTQGLADYALSIRAATKALAIDPSLDTPRISLAFAHVWLGDVDSADAELRVLAEREAQGNDPALLRLFVAFLRGESATVESGLAAAKEDPPKAEVLEHVHSFILARAGRLNEARRATRRAVSLAEASGGRERAALYIAAAAVQDAFFERPAQARRQAGEALAMSRGREVLYAAGVASALANDAARVREVADELAGRFPEDTSARYTYVPVLNALLAVRSGAPARAVSLLEPAEPYDRAAVALLFYHFFGGMYPAFVRGEAYLKAGRHDDAVREFQKVLANRGLVLADPVGVVARLQLARAYAAAGDREQARRTYEELLGIWKDADPDLEMVRRARAEFSRIGNAP